MKIIGINKSKSFISKSDNVTHNGVEIHLVQPALAPAVGMLTQVVTVWDMKPGFSDALSLQVGDVGFPINNDKGKCEGFYLTQRAEPVDAAASKK